jgi:hypothetical protein
MNTATVALVVVWQMLNWKQKIYKFEVTETGIFIYF